VKPLAYARTDRLRSEKAMFLGSLVRGLLNDG
jgi:hypothetical protein